jgi:hypothetical protein
MPGRDNPVIEPIRLDSTSFRHRQRPYLKPVFGTKLVQSLIGLARIQRKIKEVKPPEPALAKGYSQTRRTRLDFTTSPRKKIAKDRQSFERFRIEVGLTFKKDSFPERFADLPIVDSSNKN